MQTEYRVYGMNGKQDKEQGKNNPEYSKDYRVVRQKASRARMHAEA